MIFALHGSRSWRRRAWMVPLLLLLLLPLLLGDSAKVAVVDVDLVKRQRRSWGCLFAIQAGGESACFVAPAELPGSAQATVWPSAKPQACATAQRIACNLHGRAASPCRSPLDQTPNRIHHISDPLPAIHGHGGTVPSTKFLTAPPTMVQWACLRRHHHSRRRIRASTPFHASTLTPLITSA